MLTFICHSREGKRRGITNGSTVFLLCFTISVCCMTQNDVHCQMQTENVLYFSGESDNIRVYVRVRPPDKHLESEVDRTPCLEVTSGNTIVLQSKPDPKTFSFDHVADINTTQVLLCLSIKLKLPFSRLKR